MTTIDYTYGMPLVECSDTINQVLDMASRIGVQILNGDDSVNPDGWYDFDDICSDDRYRGFSVYGPMDYTEVMAVEDEGVLRVVECRPYVLHLPFDDVGNECVWLQVNVEIRVVG